VALKSIRLSRGSEVVEAQLSQEFDLQDEYFKEVGNARSESYSERACYDSSRSDEGFLLLP